METYRFLRKKLEWPWVAVGMLDLRSESAKMLDLKQRYGRMEIWMVGICENARIEVGVCENARIEVGVYKKMLDSRSESVKTVIPDRNQRLSGRQLPPS